MSGNSSIEWTDATWNPVTGCTKVSPGCNNCYAERFAERWRGIPGHPFERGFDIVLRPERLQDPLRWKKPRRVFVNSMSDLFHKDVPDEFIAQVFVTMAFASRHTFQVLTKRPERMRRLVRDFADGRQLGHALSLPVTIQGDRIVARAELAGPPAVTHRVSRSWPPTNVWLGTSVESADYAWRADMLRETPAAVRFLSLEPLLGHIPAGVLRDIDWVIVGGESGPHARPMHPRWVHSIRDACIAHRIPFFFKQYGEWAWRRLKGDGATHVIHQDGIFADLRAQAAPAPNDQPPDAWQGLARVGKTRAGRVLDGRTWDEFPERHGDASHATIPG